MTSIVSVSPADLNHRRQTLRRLRRRQIVHQIWRTIALGSLTSGLVWGVSQPVWTIQEPEQIAIEGNQLLSDRAIRSLLPLSYPQSLLRIEPQALAEQLESQQSVIAKATVSRQLFPPGLTVQIQERQPVAIALSQTHSPNQPFDTQQIKTPSQIGTVGLLDRKGTWIPWKNYTDIEKSLPLPALKIIGSRQQYLPYWSQLYQVVDRSPVKVSEIDCRNPDNLILKTELGIVHVGPYTAQLSEQLKVLDRMRQLSAKLNGRQIAYIDLKKPAAPAIQLVEPTNQSAETGYPLNSQKPDRAR